MAQTRIRSIPLLTCGALSKVRKKRSQKLSALQSGSSCSGCYLGRHCLYTEPTGTSGRTGGNGTLGSSRWSHTACQPLLAHLAYSCRQIQTQIHKYRCQYTNTDANTQKQMPIWNHLVIAQRFCFTVYHICTPLPALFESPA